MAFERVEKRRAAGTIGRPMIAGEGGFHHRVDTQHPVLRPWHLPDPAETDESDLRRGLATANAVWGNKPSVLVGDFLFARAFELMVADGSLRVLDILSRASAVITEATEGARRNSISLPVAMETSGLVP